MRYKLIIYVPFSPNLHFFFWLGYKNENLRRLGCLQIFLFETVNSYITVLWKAYGVIVHTQVFCLKSVSHRLLHWIQGCHHLTKCYEYTSCECVQMWHPKIRSLCVCFTIEDTLRIAKILTARRWLGKHKYTYSEKIPHLILSQSFFHMPLLHFGCKIFKKWVWRV